MSATVLASFVNRDGQAVVGLSLDDSRDVLLTIGGETAFKAGTLVCETCRYVFSKLGPAQRLTDGTSDDLAAGLSQQLRDVRQMPSEDALAEFAAVLAAGPYSVVLVRLAPRMVMPGADEDYFSGEAVATWGVDPFFGVGHSPRTPYYRLGAEEIGSVEYGGKRLGVVLGVPLFPPTQRHMNRQEVIDEYRQALRDDQMSPTVLALGLADDRGPAVWEGPDPDFTRHLIVSLYILDGHHKIAAAAAERLPIQFLIFLPHRYAETDWPDVPSGVELLERLAAS